MDNPIGERHNSPRVMINNASVKKFSEVILKSANKLVANKT
jgi:hypothetical protein